jgi:hypothetical protein
MKKYYSAAEFQADRFGKIAFRFFVSLTIIGMVSTILIQIGVYHGRALEQEENLAQYNVKSHTLDSLIYEIHLQKEASYANDPE